MGFAHSGEFAEMYNKIRGFIPEGSRREVANIIYDTAGDLDTDDWDGTSQLEIDGHINQDLDN